MKAREYDKRADQGMELRQKQSKKPLKPPWKSGPKKSPKR